MRFVVNPEGQVVPDVAEKLPGRGLWVRCQREVVVQAIKGKSFSKAAKQQVQVPVDLAEVAQRLLERRVLDALSLARKAGCVVAGFEKVKAALTSHSVVALLHAGDAGDDGMDKLRPHHELLVCSYFSRQALCAVLGRENVAHVAVLEGQGSAHCLRELRRFTGFIE